MNRKNIRNKKSKERVKKIESKGTQAKNRKINSHLTALEDVGCHKSLQEEKPNVLLR